MVKNESSCDKPSCQSGLVHTRHAQLPISTADHVTSHELQEVERNSEHSAGSSEDPLKI